MELMNTRMFNWKNNIATGLAKYMDIIILNENYIIYNKELNNSKTIFINTRLHEKLIIKFIDEILPKLKNKVNLIIAGGDYTFPNNTDLRYNRSTVFLNIFLNKINNIINNPNINKIYVENLDTLLPKTIPIPLGINPIESPITFDYYKEFEYISKDKPLKFTNFNRLHNGKYQFNERSIVMDFCMKNWKEFYIHTGNLINIEYLKKLSKYAFTICVHGGGLDLNPKLFEALLVGVIPIIRLNKPYTSIYTNNDLPVVIINEWNNDTITLDKLNKWHKKYISYFIDNEKRNKVLKCLSMDYWVSKIKSNL